MTPNLPQTPASRLNIIQLKALISFDVNSYLSIITGVLALAMLAASASIFFYYLYQPIFAHVEARAIQKPMINQQALENVKRKSMLRQKILTEPLPNPYGDPFRNV